MWHGVMFMAWLLVAANAKNHSNSSSIIKDSNETNVLNPNITLKFATYCVTPTQEKGHCVELKQCPGMAAIKSPKDPNYKFFEASDCTPKNAKNVKVCCGANDLMKTQIPKQQEAPVDDIDILNPLPEECGTQKLLTFNKRIFGGVEASIGEFPWMARLIHRNKRGERAYGCAGFLVHRKFIVTAAHCFNEGLTSILGPVFQVSLGDHNTSSPVDCADRAGKKCAPPPQILRVGPPIIYSGYTVQSGNHNNDIAMLQLKAPAEITNFVRPICLLDKRGPVDAFTISGWGRTENAPESDVKMKIDIDRFPFSKCENIYKENGVQLAQKNQLCAGAKRNRDSCTGDSGGPLMVEHNSVWYAEGIVSFGIGCGQEGIPGVYTNVPRYFDWIKKTINRKLTRAKSKKDHFAKV